MTNSSHIETLTIRRPDDLHLHLRDGDWLATTVAATARQFARATIMPNLTPPITDRAAAVAYRQRIIAALPKDLAQGFTPLMVAYLTDHSDAAELAAGFSDGTWVAAKLYPAHATTNSAHGVSDWRRLEAVLARMEQIGMTLLIHGEVTDPAIDIFDREAVFIDTILEPMRRQFSRLKIVMEHITTRQAVDYISAAALVEEKITLAATITAHHLIINRNAIFKGGINPHYFCLPIAKREEHRLALRQAAVSGNPRFFLGTDSAPHHAARKEAACGCAGIYTAAHALEYYAQVFDEERKLPRLEAFASEFGASFYGLPHNEGTITLKRISQKLESRITVPHGDLVVFLGGESLDWSVAA